MRQLILPIVLWALFHASLAMAQTASQESPAYTKAVSLGLTEFEDKNFAEARAHFVRAHALSPSARTLRAMGMVEFELKRYAESARLLSEALSSRDKPLDAEKRAHAEQLLERANAYIGKVTLDIEPATAVTVDGVTSNLGPGQELILEVGDHTLEFQAPERIAQKRSLTIRGGEQTPLRVRLLALSSAKSESASPGASADTRPNERRLVKNPWLWTAVGVVVAGAAAGAAIALTRDRGTTNEKPYPGSGGAPALGTPK